MKHLKLPAFFFLSFLFVSFLVLHFAIFSNIMTSAQYNEFLKTIIYSESETFTVTMLSKEGRLLVVGPVNSSMTITKLKKLYFVENKLRYNEYKSLVLLSNGKDMEPTVKHLSTHKLMIFPQITKTNDYRIHYDHME